PLELVISAIGLCLLFPEHGLEARQIAANHAQAKRILERLRRTAELEAELLLLELLHARRDVLGTHLANLISSHGGPPRASRTSCESASSRPRAPSPSRRCRASRPRARTSHGPASPRTPTFPENPCLCPCGFRPASS